jgi:hypothetical protein
VLRPPPRYVKYEKEEEDGERLRGPTESESDSDPEPPQEREPRPKPTGPYPLYDPGFICPTFFPSPDPVKEIFKRLDKLPAVPCKKHGDAQLEEAELRILLDNQVVEAHDEGPVRGYVHVYKLKEIKKGIRRGRLIVHPPELNEITKGWLQMPNLPGIEDIMKMVVGASTLGTIDLVSFFHQLLLPKCVRNFFAFTFKGKVYRMKVLPMGWTLSPAIAQYVLTAACQPQKPLVYMDDVLVDGKEFGPLLKALQHRFTVGETQVPGTTQTYLGVTVCAESKTLGICRKTRDKILLLSRKDTTFSLRAIWKSVGLLQHAHYVQGLPNGDLGKVFRLRPTPPTTARDWTDFFRRNATKKLVTAVQVALNRVLTLPPRSCIAAVRPSPTSSNGWWHLFTDASNTGGGVVLTRRLSDKALLAYGWEWSSKEKKLHINTLEAMACERGLRDVGKLLGGHVVCWVDSLTFLGATLKGWAKDPISNRSVSAIRLKAQERRTTNSLETVIAYVASKENPADGPSRGQAWDPEQLVRVPRGTIKFGFVD